MAVPEALLNAIGSSTPTSKNPLEKLGEVSFSGADGPSFSAVMREASASEQSPDETMGAEEAQDTGKGLPDSPGRASLPARLKLVPVSDQKLEEFAVDMGIDRDLARLLLSETAPEAEVESMADVVDPEVPTAIPTAVPTAVPTILTPTLVTMAARSEAAAVVDPNLEHVDTIPETPVATHASPIADEDLLLWRSRLSSATMMTEAREPAENGAMVAAAPLQSELTDTVPTASEAMPAVASTMGQLRTRAATISAVMPAADAAIELRNIDARDAVSLSSSEGLPQRLMKTERASSAEPLAVLRDMAAMTGAGAASMSASGGEGSLGERSPKHAPRDAVIPEMSFAMAASPIAESAEWSSLVAPTSSILNSATGVSASPIAESAEWSSLVAPTSSILNSATGVSAASIVVGDTSAVLSTPDPKLSFGERVQAFADAVAQRVLGQIRDENWSVSLQLDPANLGAMDIDLTMRGNTVAANVGVANGEVRALLESGLPRLRESLESAGLQLAGWTFGQSGSRAFSEPARKMFSQASLRGRVNDVDSVAEVGASRMMPGKNPASGAVDLFV